MAKQNKGRKVGHNKDRSISMKRYNMEMRWERNKKRRIATDARRQEAIRARHLRKGIKGYSLRRILRSAAHGA